MFAWVQMLAWPVAACYAAAQLRRAVACVALALMKTERETVKRAARLPAGIDGLS